MFVEKAISSESLLQLLEHLDGLLSIYGITRRNERIAAVALRNYFCTICYLYDKNYAMNVNKNVIVLRNIDVGKKFYNRIFPIGKWNTELDLIFLNVPTVFGHPCELNFHVEVEVGEKPDISTEFTRLTMIREYFKNKGVRFYPLLVCKGYKKWEDSFQIPVLDIADLEKIVEINPPTSLNDIPGMAYDDAASTLLILEYVAKRRKIDNAKELWDDCKELRRMDHEKLFEYGKISHTDYENFNFSFLPRISQLIRKICEKGLLVQCDGGWELSTDGRDILATYLSFRGE